MKRILLASVAAICLNAGAANAMNCGVVFDELHKAISGHLTMVPEKRVALARMAMSSYDHCMAGDATSAKATRAMIMSQIAKGLGGN